MGVARKDEDPNEAEFIKLRRLRGIVSELVHDYSSSLEYPVNNKTTTMHLKSMH